MLIQTHSIFMNKTFALVSAFDVEEKDSQKKVKMVDDPDKKGEKKPEDKESPDGDPVYTARVDVKTIDPKEGRVDGALRNAYVQTKEPLGEMDFATRLEFQGKCYIQTYVINGQELTVITADRLVKYGENKEVDADAINDQLTKSVVKAAPSNNN